MTKVEKLNKLAGGRKKSDWHETWQSGVEDHAKFDDTGHYSI